MVGPRRTWLARTLPVPDNSSCVVSKVIMSGEAAARPQKLQKLRQVVHGLDKSAGGGKIPTTRQNGVFVPASDDLERSSAPHS
jgi:hypothetical protein